MRWSFDLYPYVVRFGNIGPELMKRMKNVFNKNLVLASEKDQEKFFNAVFGNPKPNQKLIDATTRFSSEMKSQAFFSRMKRLKNL